MSALTLENARSKRAEPCLCLGKSPSMFARAYHIGSMQLIDVLILGAIALFVLGRLYVALGQDDGQRKRGAQRGRGPSQADGATGPERTARSTPDVGPAQDVRPAAGPLRFTGPAAAGLEEIHLADRSFIPAEFIAGARSAYEMIVKAFAVGETATLEPLLAPDVYAAWSQAISARAGTGATAPTLLRLKAADFDEADLIGDIARVDVQFEAELGDGDRVRTVREIWSFERNVRQSDPNWKLAAVSTPD